MRIAIAFIALILPGLAFWAWFHNKEDDPAQSLAQILGVSFSVIAVGSLLFYLVGLELNAWMLIVFLVLCLGLAIFGIIKKKPEFVYWQWGIMVLVLGVFIYWRLWQARTLALPNWVDSQHHVLIVRKFIEGGGLPASLEPYLPGPFYYHFSFHSVTAFFASISGQNPAQATLMLGQILNALIGLSIYSLSKSFAKDWRPALIAALFVTFITKMPGYYLTWGRYTLLTGTFLLAVAMAFAQKIREGASGIGSPITLALLTAGVLLSHYLIAFLLALYLIIMGIDWIIHSIKEKKWAFKTLLSLLMPALAGLVIALPWYLRVLKYSAGKYSLGVALPTERSIIPKLEDWKYVKDVLGPSSAYILIAVALVALVFAFIKPNYRKFGIWSLFVMLMTVPTDIQFMGFRGDYFSLIAFIPITVLSALALFWLGEQLQALWTKQVYMNAFLAIIAGAMLIIGITQNKNPINSVTIVANHDDVEAMDWINSHLPEDARFYVNTTYWGYGVYRGIDGGAWLLPYTGRFSIAPTTFFPYGLDTENTHIWRSWGERASTITDCDEDFYSLLADVDLRYIYIRDGVKPNKQEEVAGLQTETLLACPGVTQLYQNASVSIWVLDD